MLVFQGNENLAIPGPNRGAIAKRQIHTPHRQANVIQNKR
jgi:hypothetical protein